MLLTGQINDEYIYSSIYLYINTLCIFEIFHCNFFFPKALASSLERAENHRAPLLDWVTIRELFKFIGLFILAVHAAWGNLSSKQRLNPCPLQQKHGVLTTRPPGKAPGRSLKPFICTCGSQVWSSGQQHHLLFGLHSFNKVWVFPP